MIWDVDANIIYDTHRIIVYGRGFKFPVIGSDEIADIITDEEVLIFDNIDLFEFHFGIGNSGFEGIQMLQV